MADIEVDAVVLAVRHQGVVALERGRLVGVVGRVVAMIPHHQFVLSAMGAMRFAMVRVVLVVMAFTPSPLAMVNPYSMSSSFMASCML